MDMELIGDLPLFASLSDEQLRLVAGSFGHLHFGSNEAIYRQDAPGNALYVIERGVVAIQTVHGEGAEPVIVRLGAGDTFGEMGFLAQQPHADDALALTNVDAWMLTRDDFEVLATQFPALAINLVRILSARLRDHTEGGVDLHAAAPGPTAVTERARSKAAPGGPAGVISVGSSGLSQAAGDAAQWFAALSTADKLRLGCVVLLLIWLIGIAAPSLLISLLSNGLN